MSKALSIFEMPKLELPAHIANFQQQEKNIEDRTTVPSLGIEGKVFSIAMNGEKRKLTRRDDEGDDVPVATLRVVILDFAKRRGRAYYEGGYDPNKAGAPVCWSDDGVKPHDKVAQKQASVCDKCPMAAKGSKVTDNGKSVTACSQHRMLALVPASNLEHEPLRLKIAITSDWDKQNPELEAQGWFGFQNYTDFLRSKGISHTAAVVTKLKFDPNVAYPKLIFSPDRFLDEASLPVVAELAKSDKVKDLISATWTPAGVDGVKTEEVEEFKQPAPKAAAIDDGEDEPKQLHGQQSVDEVEQTPPPEAKKQAKPPADEDEGDGFAAPPPPKKANKAADDLIEKTVAKKVAADVKKAAAATKVVDDDDVEIIPPKKAAAPKTALPADVDDLLTVWDS